MLDARDDLDEPEGDALTKVTRAAFALMALQVKMADAVKADDTAAIDALCGELERIGTVLCLFRLLAEPSPDRPRATH